MTDELHALGLTRTTCGIGGVYFTGDMNDCYKANMWLRTAARVLLELGRFPAQTPASLYKGAKAIVWGDLFRLNQTFAVFANVRDSLIDHSGFTALKVKDAIADSFRTMYGRRPNVDTKDPDIRVYVRIYKDECVINLDTSGESLHKRGYRLEKGEAPLRETLAAAILYLAGYDGKAVLCDFMCGSGTIAIEAAMIAMNVAPGLLRKNFGFQRLISFNKRAWRRVVDDATAKRRHKVLYYIYASDISKKNIEITKSNARRADVRSAIDISVGDFKDTVKQSDTGLLISNPPYGERLDADQDEKLIELYKTIGDTLKNGYTGYDAYIFSGNPELVKKIGLKAAKKTPLYNGAIECRLMKYELYEGTVVK